MIIIGSDHAGTELRYNIINYVSSIGKEIVDITESQIETDDDYPDVAYKLCEKVLENSDNLGIAICGTGIGISIACNKVKNIRAALCTDEYTAKFSRVHNNANVLCLGARTSTGQNEELVKKIVETFLNSEFEGGRHQRRLDKITAIEGLKTGDNGYETSI